MFSREYLTRLSEQTTFRADSLQKQITLLDILREINRHPILRNKLALKGGTAINLLWFELPRLSVDIDLNYVGSEDRDTMLKERPKLEQELRKIIQSKSISVEHAPEEHAGAKWRLRAPNAFGGNFTLEVDLNYIMRVPLWGTVSKRTVLLDQDFLFDCKTVSFEELFAGKIKALMDRSAARDLYDVYKLSKNSEIVDTAKLRKALILFGLTCNDDWRMKDYRTINEIDAQMIDEQLNPLLRTGDPVDLDEMKKETLKYLKELMKYDEKEKKFMNRFLDDGTFEPEVIAPDAGTAERWKKHPAVLWKLQNHRQHLGLEPKNLPGK